MKQYLKLIKEVLETGDQRPDRTGVGTISKFGMQVRFDLSAGFPAVTTKKLAWRAVVSELLWIIEGSGDELRLREILHGNRYSTQKTIWTDNAGAEYWTKRNHRRHAGDLGRIYGVQWRRWRKPVIRINKVILHNHDQLLELINGIKDDPYSRRHILSAWNPGEIELMALPPCHVMSQFYVNNGRLSCQMYQRSGDLFLGVPFNIASYALLTHMMAQQCNLDVGDFIWTGGDCHLYSNHLEQVDLQLSRDFFPLPKLNILRKPDSIFDYEFEDFEITGYESHPHIKAPVAI